MVHHGKNGAIYCSTSAAGVAGLVAHISDFTLDMVQNTVETTSMGDTNKTYVTGLKDVKGTLTGFWDDTDDTLFEAADSIDGVVLALYPSVIVPGKCFSGPAWLDVSIKTGVAAAVTLAGNFVANGSWKRT
jgi:hypothetical protein